MHSGVCCDGCDEEDHAALVEGGCAHEDGGKKHERESGTVVRNFRHG